MEGRFNYMELPEPDFCSIGELGCEIAVCARMLPMPTLTRFEDIDWINWTPQEHATLLFVRQADGCC